MDGDHDEEFTVPAATVLGGIRLLLWSRPSPPYHSCNKEGAIGNEVVSFLAVVPVISVSD